MAEQQHGVVARWQLLERGWRSDTIRSWVRRGWLHPVHHGTYAVGHRRLSADGRMMAAVLACGPGAALSHRTAAGIWVIRRTGSSRIEVTVPRSRRGRPGITIHRTRHLAPEDVTVRDGFPVTSVARTLVDIAGAVTAHELVKAVDSAERLGLFDLRAVEAACDRAKGRRGADALRRTIALWREPPFTRSELEAKFAFGCEKRGIPPPSFNVDVLGQEVDEARYRPFRFTSRQLDTEKAWQRLSAALTRRP